MKKIDVVYALGDGSRWNDNELRFSLRSVVKNLRGVRNIVVVGNRPDWIDSVLHIPARDVFNPSENADGNIISKVLRACRHKDVSDDFLFINDDHLILKPIAAIDVPPFHKGDMTTFSAKYWQLNFWRKRLRRTMEILVHRGLPALHYDCHTPIVFNKKRFEEVVKKYAYYDGIGYTMKSLYGNEVYKQGTLLQGHKKMIATPHKLDELNRMLENPGFLSFNDNGLNFAFKWWLISNFPEKSKFEKDEPSEMIFDLYWWHENGKQFSEGISVFERNFKHPNLLKLLKGGETPVLRDKLEYKLMKHIKEL